MCKHQSRGDTPDLTISEAVDLYIRRKRINWNGETEETYQDDLKDLSSMQPNSRSNLWTTLLVGILNNSRTTSWIRTIAV